MYKSFILLILFFSSMFSPLSAATPHWTFDMNRFASSMTITAVVVKANGEVRSGDVEIAAFNGNECRGSAMLQYSANMDRYIGFLMVYGDGNESITLKVYDHVAAKEYAAVNEPLVFVADIVHGNPGNPYTISLHEDIPVGNRLIIVTAEGNGNASANAVSAPPGTNVTLTATAGTGYRFVRWEVVSGGITLANATAPQTTFTMPDNDVVVKAVFELIPSTFSYTVMFVVAGGNGSLSATVDGSPVASGTSVEAGKSVVFTAAPAAGYTVKEWRSNGNVVGSASNAYTLTNLSADAIVTILFELIPSTLSYTVMYVVAGGSGSLSATVDGSPVASGTSVETGKSVVFSAAPATGNKVMEWRRDGVKITGNTSNTYTLANLSAHTTVTVVFDRTTNSPELSPANPLRAWTCNGMLHVTGLTAGETLDIFNATGALIYHNVVISYEVEIQLTAQGVYIVRSGNNAMKVANW